MRKKHSHRCSICHEGVYCYKGGCTLPQRLERCSYCAQKAQTCQHTRKSLNGTCLVCGTAPPIIPEPAAERPRLATHAHMRYEPQPAATLQPDDRVELLLAGQADTEYESKLEAQRCTLELSVKSARRQAQHEDGALFGGARQFSLW